MKNYNNDTYIKKINDYAQEAYIWAEDSLIDKAVNMNIKKIIQEVELSKKNMNEKLNNLENLLISEIKRYLLTYDKNELIIVLLGLKAYLRTEISSSTENVVDYEFCNRHEGILWLIKITLFSCESEFKNRSLIDGTKNLAMSFRFIYYYNVLKDNIECFLEQLDKKDSDREVEISDFFKEGVFYTDEYNKYMNDVLSIGLMENPDDTNIETLSIKLQMEIEGINKEKIKKNIDNIINKYFGFNFNNLYDFIYWGLKQKPEKFLIIKDKEEYFKLIEQELGKSYDVFNNIIKTFSLNSLVERNDLNGDLRHIELRSIFEIENTMIFYPFDFAFNCSCFEKFMLRRHFVEYYSALLNTNEKDNLNRELSKYEADISTYLSYVIAEQLHLNGYKLPMKNNCPCVEVSSIVVKNQLNLLKNKNGTLGDIDVLALDEMKKEIYNIEIKYYKPLQKLREINSENKINEREKNLVTPQKRASILAENINYVVEFLGGQVTDGDEYKVRTILLTPRPDYWLLTDSKDIEYYTWIDFINNVEKRSI